MALFVCFSTRAIHLEAVSDLSADSLMAALRRFVFRRGLPQTIYTDNGTNFVAVDSDLKAAYALLDTPPTKQKVAVYRAEHTVTWKRIPARAPNFGGLWETAVHSDKRLLKKATYNLSLTFKEFDTVMTQVEAILNNRPVVPLETPAEDRTGPLTPGHFLIGTALCSLPNNLTSRKPTRHWNLLQKTTEKFWQRWSSDSLRQLNHAVFKMDESHSKHERR